jgi:hypothetical protein
MFDNLIRVNLNELNKLNSAYANKEEFSEADAKKLDVLTCTLSRLMKSLPYIEEYGWDQNHDLSGRRGRDSMGRYTSMDMGRDMSGHWPGPPPVWSGAYRGYPPDGYYR